MPPIALQTGDRANLLAHGHKLRDRHLNHSKSTLYSPARTTKNSYSPNLTSSDRSHPQDRVHPIPCFLSKNSLQSPAMLATKTIQITQKTVKLKTNLSITYLPLLSNLIWGEELPLKKPWSTSFGGLFLKERIRVLFIIRVSARNFLYAPLKGSPNAAFSFSLLDWLSR